MKAPRYKQSFFVNGKYLGEAMRQPVRVHENTQAPHGTALFCPDCASVWAVFPVVDTMTQEQLDFMPYRVLCASHALTDWGHVPGSIWSSWDREFNSILPDDVIRYEFNQAMKLYKE